jgi:hypothetical protein
MNMSSGASKVLLAIGALASGQPVKISLDGLQARTGLSRPAVVTAIHELRISKLLTVRRNARRCVANEYTLNPKREAHHGE